MRAGALALAAALAVGVPGAASATALDGPSECVTVKVLAYQSDGSVHRTWLEWCGNGGPGDDSPMRDAVNGGTGVLDGATRIGGGQCGTKLSPCVIFGPG